MASVILSRTIGGTEDKRIVLQNSNFARPFVIASGWNKIRVAIRGIANNVGGNITPTPRFYMGLCSGSTNIVLDPTTTHFLGIAQNSGTLTYAAGPPARFTGVSFRTALKVGAVLTIGAADILAAGSTGWMCDPTTANRFMIFADIDRTTGSPYSINAFCRVNPTLSSDVSVAQFLETAEEAAPVFTNHSIGTARTQAVNEGVDGALNHVNIGWDRASPGFEICDLALVKLS